MAAAAPRRLVPSRFPRIEVVSSVGISLDTYAAFHRLLVRGGRDRMPPKGCSTRGTYGWAPRGRPPKGTDAHGIVSPDVRNDLGGGASERYGAVRGHRGTGSRSRSRSRERADDGSR